VDAFPSEVFKGAVRQVRNAPQTVQNVVTYDAVVDVANPKLKL
jgi:HlyD family secretion protein